ncbi:hypothetical protein C7974DRAFT_424413 [Boeremia exigua]|uniref:uncharacterized protein n=1 Tax=Boeremia exigua TaxID=749465 RepID=UPI001E8D20DF|nr:uncharacterized protein C7974DRAFT_424413 [Boeremia exigua]KAH6629357.1 hypothetical protein C7974DRAFT_424413 [Boeremia exigua]
MKLTLIIPYLCVNALVSASDCDPGKPERWDAKCFTSTTKSTSKTSTISTTSTTLATSSMSTSTASAASLTVATETVCYLGEPTPTTYTVSTAQQICTMSTYLTVTTSTIYDGIVSIVLTDDYRLNPYLIGEDTNATIASIAAAEMAHFNVRYIMGIGLDPGRMWIGATRQNRLRIMDENWVLYFDCNPDKMLEKSVREQNEYLATRDLMRLPQLRWAADLKFLAERYTRANGTTTTRSTSEKDYFCCNTTAHHNEHADLGKPDQEFRLFPADLEYRHYFPAVASFEKCVNNNNLNTARIHNADAISVDWLSYIQRFELLPAGFNLRAFMSECAACYEWLIELGVDMSMSDRHRDVAISKHEVAQTNAPAYPVASLPSEKAPFYHTTSESSNITSRVGSRMSNSYPHLVYITGFHLGAPQVGHRGYGDSGSVKDLHGDAQSKKLDIRLLGSLQLSVDELCAFFPLHYTWHPYLERLQNGEWTPIFIARLMAYYRDYTDKVQLGALRNRVQKQLENISEKGSPTKDFTVSSWEIKLGGGSARTTEGMKNSLIDDCQLSALVKGVKHLPQGPGRRHLTMAIERAREQGDDLLLSQVPFYVKVYRTGEDLPDMSTYTKHPDVASHEAFKLAVDSARKGEGDVNVS